MSMVYKRKIRSSVWIAGAGMLGFGLLAGCFSLDPFLFTGKPVSHYSFDAYTGDRECDDALDTLKALGEAQTVADSCIRQYTLASGNGEIAAVLVSKNRPPFGANSDTVVVYFHGTGDHIDFYWPRTRMIHAAGYPVLVFDYRGFGASAGTATEESISEDGRTVMNFIRDSLGDPWQIVYAYSLGSLPGCDVLANGNYPRVIRVVLEAPIGSVQTIVENGSFLDLPGSYLSTYTGDNTERIKSIHAPLLWLHGTLDETNDRETHGLPIWNNHRGEGYFITAIGGKHSTNPQTIGYTRYIGALKSFFGGNAGTAFPQLFAGAGRVEWGAK